MNKVYQSRKLRTAQWLKARVDGVDVSVLYIRRSVTFNTESVSRKNIKITHLN